MGYEDLKTKVIKQLEFYFSDINLVNDQFLTDLMSKEDGWISFDTLMTFNRLKKLVSNNKNVFKDILKTIESDLVEVLVGDEKVRRKIDRPLPPIGEDSRKLFHERTVHLDGFPTDTTEEEVMKWLQSFGEIQMLQMRYKKGKHRKQEFKGCLFATFTNKSVVEKIIDEPFLGFKGNSLLKENKMRYYERKRQFLDNVKTQRQMKRENNPPVTQEVKTVPIPYNASVLKLMNVPTLLSQKTIADFFGKFLTDYRLKVRFVTKVFSKSITYVRFDGLSTANEIVKKIRSTSDAKGDDESVIKVIIEDNEIIVDVLTEEEKRTFWRKTLKQIDNVKKLKAKREEWEQMRSEDSDFKLWSQRRIDKRVDNLKIKGVLMPNALLKITYDLNQDKHLTEDMVRKFFYKYAYICQITSLDGSMTIRFANRYDAKNVLAVTKLPDTDFSSSMTGNFIINGVYCWAQVLTGPEENKFWSSSIDVVERSKIEKLEEEKRKRKVARIEKKKNEKNKKSLDDSGYAGTSPLVRRKRFRPATTRR